MSELNESMPLELKEMTLAELISCMLRKRMERYERETFGHLAPMRKVKDIDLEVLESCQNLGEEELGHART